MGGTRGWGHTGSGWGCAARGGVRVCLRCTGGGPDLARVAQRRVLQHVCCTRRSLGRRVLHGKGFWCCMHCTGRGPGVCIARGGAPQHMCCMRRGPGTCTLHGGGGGALVLHVLHKERSWSTYCTRRDLAAHVLHGEGSQHVCIAQGGVLACVCCVEGGPGVACVARGGVLEHVHCMMRSLDARALREEGSGHVCVAQGGSGCVPGAWAQCGLWVLVPAVWVVTVPRHWDLGTAGSSTPQGGQPVGPGAAAHPGLILPPSPCPCREQGSRGRLLHVQRHLLRLRQLPPHLWQ